MHRENDTSHEVLDLIDAAASMVANHKQLTTETKEFIGHLKMVVQKYGVKTTRTSLTLAPLAQAKGDSKAEIDLMIDRYDRGLMANAFVTLDPNNKRFPCEVVGTGRIGPHGLDVGQPRHRSAG